MVPGARPRPALRIGWKFVRGIGDKYVQQLRDARDRDGPFTSITDVVRRGKLTRAEVEWLLATHECKGVLGPADRAGERSRQP